MNAVNFKHAATTVASFPAYDIVRRTTRDTFFGTRLDGKKFTVLDAGDELGLAAKGYYRSYSIHSVISYAMECAEDPIVAVQRAESRGENLHWINQNATCLSASPQAKRTMVEVTIGMLVLFEGRFFTIELDNNYNLALIPA